MTTDIYQIRNSIPVTYTRFFARELRLGSTSISRLLKHTGLTVESLTDSDVFITRHQQIQICRNAVSISGDQALGLRVGNQISLTSLGPIGFLVMSSPDLNSALQEFQTHLPRQLGFVQFPSESSGEFLEYKIVLDIDMADETYRFLIEIFVLVINKVIEFILGEKFTEGKVNFRFSRPDNARLYAQYLGCKVNFDQAENSIMIPQTLCRRMNMESNQETYSFALKQFQSMMQKLPADGGDMLLKLKKVLLSQAPGTLTETDAAQALFISKRTLARKLRIEDTSFKQVNEVILATLAASYLKETRLNVETIALLLNYHDASNFRRAFKRWYQVTPSAYRTQYSDAAPA